MYVFQGSKLLKQFSVCLRMMREPMPGVPDFSFHNKPKQGEIYQIATKLPNGHKIYQMAVLNSKWP
jgi:hypothetical protein